MSSLTAAQPCKLNKKNAKDQTCGWERDALGNKVERESPAQKKETQHCFSRKPCFTLESVPFSMALSFTQSSTFRKREKRRERQKYTQEWRHSSHCDTCLILTLLSGSVIFMSIMVFQGNVIMYVHFRWQKGSSYLVAGCVEEGRTHACINNICVNAAKWLDLSKCECVMGRYGRPF